MSTRYSYGAYLRQAAQKGRKAMTKATTKTVKRVVKPMKSTEGVIHRPKPHIEAFGASNRKVTPTTRLTKGAIGGTIPERGSK
jgi:hypothetical protein